MWYVYLFVYVSYYDICLPWQQIFSVGYRLVVDVSCLGCVLQGGLGAALLNCPIGLSTILLVSAFSTWVFITHGLPTLRVVPTLGRITVPRQQGPQLQRIIVSLSCARVSVSGLSWSCQTSTPFLSTLWQGNSQARRMFGQMMSACSMMCECLIIHLEASLGCDHATQRPQATPIHAMTPQSNLVWPNFPGILSKRTPKWWMFVPNGACMCNSPTHFNSLEIHWEDFWVMHLWSFSGWLSFGVCCQ